MRRADGAAGGFGAWLLVALLAGCAGPPHEGGDADPPMAADGSRPLAWALSGCSAAYAIAPENGVAASQGVPPGYQTIGRGTNVTTELTLRVIECSTAVLGDNRSVLRPFRWAELVMAIAPENETQPPFEDRLLREIFVEDEAIAASLAAYGLPAKAAAIQVREGEDLQFRIEGDGVSYVMAGPYGLFGQADGEREVRWRLHAMAGDARDRHVWVDQVEKVPARTSWLDAGSLETAGGYLGQAVPMGRTPAPGGFDEGMDFQLTFGAPPAP